MNDSVEQTSSTLSVSVVTDAAIPALFDFLTVPANHVRLDGSGRLMSAGQDPLRAVGDTFIVEMEDPQSGRYTVENRVVELVPDVQIAWMPGGVGRPATGIRWDWQFDIGPKGETVITQTCDWSRVTDEAYLAKHKLPRISAEEMRMSIRRLIDLVSSYS